MIVPNLTFHLHTFTQAPTESAQMWRRFMPGGGERARGDGAAIFSATPTRPGHPACPNARGQHGDDDASDGAAGGWGWAGDDRGGGGDAGAAANGGFPQAGTFAAELGAGRATGGEVDAAAEIVAASRFSAHRLVKSMKAARATAGAESEADTKRGGDAAPMDTCMYPKPAGGEGDKASGPGASKASKKRKGGRAGESEAASLAHSDRDGGGGEGERDDRDEAGFEDGAAEEDKEEEEAEIESLIASSVGSLLAIKVCTDHGVAAVLTAEVMDRCLALLRPRHAENETLYAKLRKAFDDLKAQICTS